MFTKNNKFKIAIQLFLSICSCVFLISCAAPTAPNYSGGWIPVNQFDTGIKVIPKVRPYVYEAIKIDTTLSSMLERWAADSKINYKHNCDSDFTLPTTIVSIKASTLATAMKLTNDLYLLQGVSVTYTADGVLSFACKAFELTFPQP
jgi:hypothetical protein